MGASPHLLAGLDGNVLGKDLLGLGDHLGLGFDLLEFLTGQPELQVLLAELGAQEGPEGSEPICGGQGYGSTPTHRQGTAPRDPQLLQSPNHLPALPKNSLVQTGSHGTARPGQQHSPSRS